VTGIGLWTSLGADRESTWEGIRRGKSGATVLPSPLVPSPSHNLGCPLFLDLNQEPPENPTFEVVRRISSEALIDSGLLNPSVRGSEGLAVDRERVATLVGLSKGCVKNLGVLSHASSRKARNLEAGEDGFASIWAHSSWPNSGASAVSRLHDLRGPCIAPVAACATGLVAVLQGMALIQHGTCDVVLAGSADTSLEPTLMGAFKKMGVLAHQDEGKGPSQAARPWDRDRTGFVVGEGGAILILESAEHAQKRGAIPYAEVAGGALGSDAYHATTMNPNPHGLAALIGRALAYSNIQPDQIDHVNVHGTGTRVNDPIECQSIQLALPKDYGRIAYSANKSQIGHLLGAAGAVELALTCLSMRDCFVPPILNLENPDPACALGDSPGIGRTQSIRAALKLSIGFGGHLAAALLRQPDGTRRAVIRGPD